MVCVCACAWCTGLGAHGRACVSICVHTCSAQLVVQAWLCVHTCASVCTRSPDVHLGVSREIPQDTRSCKFLGVEFADPSPEVRIHETGLRKKRC